MGGEVEQGEVEVKMEGCDIIVDPKLSLISLPLLLKKQQTALRATPQA